MRRYADPTRCPDCDAALSGDPTCPRCRIPLGTPAGAALFEALSAADRELAWLRANRAPAAAAAVAPVPAMAATAVGPPAYREPSYDEPVGNDPSLLSTPSSSPPFPPPFKSFPAPAPRPDGVRTGLRGASVPRVLLTLSVLSLLIGAAVFMAVTWSRIGIGTQTAILLATTLAAGAGSHLLHRRGLHAGSEALVVITAGLAGLDALGAVSAGWFGSGRSGLFDLAVAGGAVAVAGVVLGAGQRGAVDGPVDGQEGAPAGTAWAPSVAAQLAAAVGLLVATWSAVAIQDADRVALTLAVLVQTTAATTAAYVPARVVRILGATGAALAWGALVVVGLGAAVSGGLDGGDLDAGAWFGGDALALAVAVALAVATAHLPRAAEGLRRTAAALAVVIAVPVVTMPALDNSLLAFEACVLGALAVVAVGRVVLARRVPETAAAPARRRWHRALLVGAGVGIVVVALPTLLLGLLTAGAYAAWTAVWSVGPLASLPLPAEIDATLLESTTVLVVAPVVLALAGASLATLPGPLAGRVLRVRAAALGGLGVAPLTAYAALLGAPVVALAGAWVLLAAGLGLATLTRRLPVLLGAPLAHVALGLALLLSLPSAAVGAGVLAAWVALVAAGASRSLASRSTGALVLRTAAAGLLPLGAAISLAVHSVVTAAAPATLVAGLVTLVAGLVGVLLRPRAVSAPVRRAGEVAGGVLALAGTAAAVAVGLGLVDHLALAYAVAGGAVLCLATATTLVPARDGAESTELIGWTLGEPLRWLLVAAAGAVTLAVAGAVVAGAVLQVPLSEGWWTRLPVVPGEWVATIPITLAFVALLAAAEPVLRDGTGVLARHRRPVLTVAVGAGLLAATALGLPRVVLVGLLLLAGAGLTASLAVRRTSLLGAGFLAGAAATALASEVVLAVATTVAALTWAGADVVRRRGADATPTGSWPGAAAVVSGSLALVVSSDLVGLRLVWSALPVLVLVAGLVALGAWSRRVDPVLEAAAAASGLAAALFSLAAAVAAGDPEELNLVASVLLAVGGAVVSAHAVSHSSRRRAGWIGSVLVAGSTWLRLVDAGIDVPEAYTLPSALGLLAFGLWRVRQDPDVSTRRALGPGLYLAITPSLLVAWTGPDSWRAALLLVACLVLVLLGTRLRWSEPLLVGGIAGTVMLLREAAPLLSGGPQWIPFVLAGLLLGLVALTWEARTADVRRAAAYLGRLR